MGQLLHAGHAYINSPVDFVAGQSWQGAGASDYTLCHPSRQQEMVQIMQKVFPCIWHHTDADLATSLPALLTLVRNTSACIANLPPACWNLLVQVSTPEGACIMAVCQAGTTLWYQQQQHLVLLKAPVSTMHIDLMQTGEATLTNLLPCCERLHLAEIRTACCRVIIARLDRLSPLCVNPIGPSCQNPLGPPLLSSLLTRTSCCQNTTRPSVLCNRVGTRHGF